MDTELDNKTCLVTRPAQQADKLIGLLQQHGATVLHQPAIQIIATASDPESLQILDRIDEYDLLIFISKNAVDYFIERLRETRHWPDKQTIAAVGRATAEALRHHGLPVDIEPESGFNSESLLAMPALQQVNRQRILILRGGAGRETLRQTLQQRGADITYLDVYQRVKAPLLLNEHELAQINVLFISSQQGLENLCDMLPSASLSHLKTVPLFVPGERSRVAAEKRGFKKVITASDATDEAMVDAARHYFYSK